MTCQFADDNVIGSISRILGVDESQKRNNVLTRVSRVRNAISFASNSNTYTFLLFRSRARGRPRIDRALLGSTEHSSAITKYRLRFQAVRGGRLWCQLDTVARVDFS